MSIFSAVANLFAGLVTAVNAWFKRQEREDYKQHGRLDHEIRNRDKTDEAEARKDAVKPPTKDEVIKDLEGGKF